MYTANKRPKKYKILLKFLLILLPFVLIAIGAFWFFFLRDNSDISSTFSKEGGQVIVARPATKDFENEFFKITLQSTWVANGKKNPFSNQVYYEFQNKAKNDDNRYLRVYLDVFPKDFPLNRLLPITVADNAIVPGIMSDECDTFTGAPDNNADTKVKNDIWLAKWQGIDFVCSMTNPQNIAGTASVEEGLATTFVNQDGTTKHKYFFLYIDHNVRPDYQLFSDALKSFATK